MGRPRSELQTILETLAGSENVYFQPPAGLQMEYPAIVYERDNAETTFADNQPYRFTKKYAVTVIDRDPDSQIPDAIARLPLCSFDRHFKVDNLNHDVYTIFF